MDFRAKSIGFRSRQRDEHLDAANQGVSDGHSLWKTPANPIFPARDYLIVHLMRRNYSAIITDRVKTFSTKYESCDNKLHKLSQLPI